MGLHNVVYANYAFFGVYRALSPGSGAGRGHSCRVYIIPFRRIYSLYTGSGARGHDGNGSRAGAQNCRYLLAYGAGRGGVCFYIHGRAEKAARGIVGAFPGNRGGG